MALKWTKTALRTVDEIAGFIAKDNPSRATSFVLELKEATTKLQVHPGMGRAGRVPGTRDWFCTRTTLPSIACAAMTSKF